MDIRKYDEETRGLLKKIVEGQAYRQLMLANIRGHGLKYLPAVEDKLERVAALNDSLRQFQDVERLYAGLGYGDVVTAVRDKMERIPYPTSRMELAVCLFLCERVAHHALLAYQDSSCVEFAAIARTRLAASRSLEQIDDSAFVEYCQDPTNRPHAGQLVQRWLSITLLSLGRPGSLGDGRAVALGLRTEPIETIARGFLDGLAPFLERCHLALPDAETLGLELPAGIGGSKS